jgi:YHS domain-containing protein
MTTTTDPVCGRQFDDAQTVAQIDHALRTYSFCSLACRDQFAAEPEQFSSQPSPPACANCGGSISQDDVVCPHCGISLVAG